MERVFSPEMFNSKTLLIVGAGASNEVGLPVGSELAKLISQQLYFEFEHNRLLKGDGDFLNYLGKLFEDVDVRNEHLRAARQISDGITLANSIDRYIDIHHGDDKIQLCGKMAIVRSILHSEGNSKLFIDNDKRGDNWPFPQLDDTWFVKFFDILSEGIRLQDVENIFENVSIISFNYDRCIQHFLKFAISSLYSITQNEAEKIVETLRIYFPYGSVGKLVSDKNPGGITFGVDPNRLDIAQLSSEIKTFSEQIEDRSLTEALRREVLEAETIIFLGFAFHPQNMDLLIPEAGKRNCKRAIATAIGTSDEDCDVVINQIKPLIGKLTDVSRMRDAGSIRVRNDRKCHALFDEYRKHLSIPI